MSSNTQKDQEQEVKFFLTDLAALQARLEKGGARLVQPRVHEFNLRFDTPTGELSHGEQVLRLRQDPRGSERRGPGSTGRRRLR